MSPLFRCLTIEETVKLPFSNDGGNQQNSLSYFEGATEKLNIFYTRPFW
jgi:hypothetical protein